MAKPISPTASNIARLILIAIAVLASCPVQTGFAQATDLPPDPQLKILATSTLLTFDRAVKAKDFTAFHKLASAALARQMSADDMRQAFHEFIEKKADLSNIAGNEPVWDKPPSLLENVLLLQGRYPVMPIQTLFQLKFKNEDGAWKVHGIDVKLKRAEATPAPVASRPATVPSDTDTVRKQMEDLATRTILAFNDCVQARDFGPLLKHGATPFQRQLTPEKLLAAFRQFVDKHIDVSVVRDAEPVFDVLPEVDSGNVLTLRGQYPTSPIVLFQMRFLQEDGRWKLLGINVRTEEPGKTKRSQP